MLINRKEIYELIKNDDVEAIRALFVQGWDPNYTDEELSPGRSKNLPINFVIEMKNMPLLQLFVENGAELNYKGEPTAVEASQWSTPEILRYLVKHGAGINTLDFVGKSTIDGAIFQSKEEDALEMIKTLVELEVDIKKYGGPGLYSAAWNGQLSIIK